MSRRAFTIMETILAMVIILLGFLAVARVLPNSHRATMMTKNHVTAMRIARNILDTVRSLPYGANVDSLKTPAGDIILQEQIEDATTSITFKPDITFVSGGNAAKLDQAADEVIVTIRWRELATGGTDAADTDKFISLRGGVTLVP